MFCIKSEGITHWAGWADINESYGLSACGFSFSVDRLNKGPWPGALRKHLFFRKGPGWIRKVNEPADVDCMACIAAGVS